MRILCEICNERQATVHLSKTDGQSVGKMDLCSVCCPLDKSEKEDQETINKFMQGMPPRFVSDCYSRPGVSGGGC